MDYEITRRQATFWDLRHAGGVERIHFLGKEEFAYVDPRVPSYSIVEQHAVLVDYEFAWEHVYLAGPVAALDEILDQLTQAIETHVDGWRPATRYLNEFGAERILREGHGLLLSAPVPVAGECRTVLNASGVGFSCLPGRPSRWPRQALIAGVNYVVAKSFRVEAVT